MPQTIISTRLDGYVYPEELAAESVSSDPRKEPQFVGFQCLCGQRHAQLKELIECQSDLMQRAQHAPILATVTA